MAEKWEHLTVFYAIFDENLQKRVILCNKSRTLDKLFSKFYNTVVYFGKMPSYRKEKQLAAA